MNQGTQIESARPSHKILNMSNLVFNVANWLREDAKRSTEPLIARPSLLGYYSKAKNKLPLISSKEAIRVYQPPSKMPLDLAKHAYDDRDEEDGQASPVQWVVNCALASDAYKHHPGQIFTFRNNLNKLLGTILNPRSEWAIDGTLIAGHTDGSLHLEIVKLPQKPFPGSGLFNYLGRKFEQVVTVPLSESQIGPGSECCLVVSLGLGCHRIVMGAEVDCLASSQALIESESFLELKTVKHNAANLARNQYPKWWVQSFLVGISKIVVGSRDDDKGEIVQVHELKVQELPSLAQAAGFPFDAAQSLRFGEAALSWMFAVAKDQPQKTVRFTFDPHTRLIEAKCL